MGPLPKTTKKQKGVVSFDPQVFLATVGAARTITECPKDYKIFSQGDPADAVFYIQQGRVKLKVKSKQGKEAVIAILGAGDFLGEGCLIGQTVCLVTATTIAPGFILRIEKSEMLRVLHEERRFSDFFVPYVLSRNVRTQEGNCPRRFGMQPFWRPVRVAQDRACLQASHPRSLAQVIVGV